MTNQEFSSMFQKIEQHSERTERKLERCFEAGVIHGLMLAAKVVADAEGKALDFDFVAEWLLKAADEMSELGYNGSHLGIAEATTPTVSVEESLKARRLLK